MLPHLAVRSVHVLAVALLVGGAALAWGALRPGEDDSIPARVAVTYEWLFWAAAGLAVVTGVGNLGAFAPSIPGLDTAWGVTLAVKLVAVVGLLVGSLVRTLAVVRWLADVGAAPPDRLRVGYAATAAYLVALVVIAEVLAHG